MDDVVTLERLPLDLLSRIFEFMDHATLHQVERTCREFYVVIHQPETNAWRQTVLLMAFLDERLWRKQHSSDATSFTSAPWKSLACAVVKCRTSRSLHAQHVQMGQMGHKLAHLQDHPQAPSNPTNLLHSVLDCTSADRESETADNTLKLSSCWLEIQKYHDTSHLNHPFLSREHGFLNISIGERIQLKCGCSSGASCYWSSSSSVSPDAMESIEYVVKTPCIVHTMELLPYRVYWHPGSPTYGPKRVSFEFFYDEPCLDGSSRFHRTRVYKSPVFDVINDMQMQQFAFEHNKCLVLTQGNNPLARNVLRVTLYGRHQKQTFELPPWLHPQPEDRLPKYYVCLSYVGASGTLYSAQSPQAREKHQQEPEQEELQTRVVNWAHQAAPWY